MKKQCITLFGLGVAVGIVITILCIVIMRKPADQTNLAEETTYTQDTKGLEVASNTETEKTLDIETEKNCSNYEVANTDNSMLEGENTPIRSEERIIYDNAVKAYMSGEWDGMEMLIDGAHTIKLDEGGGYILLDGYIAVDQKNLDIPEYAYDNICSYEYVPGQGTYTIIDKKLVKFLRGEQITLPGEELSWKGFQDIEDLISKMPDSYIMYDLPTLIYNKIDGKLYLTSGDETCTLDNSMSYVYVFDDINISKMKYLGKVDFGHRYPGNVDIEALINQNK